MLAVSIPKMILNKTTQCGLFWKETDIIYSPGNKYKTQGATPIISKCNKNNKHIRELLSPPLRCLSIPNQGCMEHAVDRSHPPVESLRRQWWGQVLLPSTSAIVFEAVGVLFLPCDFEDSGVPNSSSFSRKIRILAGDHHRSPSGSRLFYLRKFGPMLI